MFAVSSLCWKVGHEREIKEALLEIGVSNIELAPAMYFNDLTSPSRQEFDAFESLFSEFRTVGMQSILFGKKDLHIFEKPNETCDFISCCAKILHELNGGGYIVFGAPKNRIMPDGLTERDARKMASKFFEELGTRVKEYNVFVNIEPNPSIYGGNFLLNASEVTKFVKELNHPSIGFHFDYGEQLENKYSKEETENFVKLCNSAHASVPYLKIPDKDSVFEEVFSFCKKHEKNISIEFIGSVEPTENTRALKKLSENWNNT